MSYAREYAIALFDLLLEQNKLTEVTEDFEMVTSLILSDKNYLRLLEHPQVTTEEKKALIKELFTSLDQSLLHFLYVLIDNKRINLIQEIYTIFYELYKSYLQVMEVEAITSEALTETQIEAITNNLSQKYRRKVVLSNVIDRSIIGGIRIVTDHEIIDHSISKQLENLKSFLLKQN